MIRIAYVDTAFQGLGMEVTTAQGKVEARTYPPHGALLRVAGVDHEITANALADIGRFFLAAAVHCGEEIGGMSGE